MAWPPICLVSLLCRCQIDDVGDADMRTGRTRAHVRPD
jgi:hypothetical protein